MKTLTTIQGTHAAGINAQGTPHTIDYGQGNKAQTSEPATVGQAPKDVSANLPRAEDPPAPGYLAQAQQAASSAVGAASSAVGSLTGAVGGLGLGGKKEETKDEPEEKKSDVKVDAASDDRVERFLQEQTTTKAKK